jgi:hypothetical protein
MKKILIALIGILVFFAMPLSTEAKPSKTLTFDRWRVTTSDMMQTEPIIYKDSVYFRLVQSNVESDIWKQDLKTKIETPVIQKPGDELPVAANNKGLLHSDYISPDNWYDVNLYNFKTGQDIPIAVGSENQVAQDMDGNNIIYNTGFAWPDLYLYNIKTKENKFIAHEAIRPRISGNTIVWIHSFGSGYATVWSYDIKTGETTQVPNGTARNETWPEINKNIVVWQGAGIFLKDLKTGEEKKISEQGESPVIWGDFIAWTQPDATGPYNIYAYDIKTNTSTKISNDGTSGSSSRNPSIYKDTLVWQSAVTGQVDIYAAKLFRK